jgi:hypothetical protein
MKTQKALQLVTACFSSPRQLLSAVKQLPAKLKALEFQSRFKDEGVDSKEAAANQRNPFLEYCTNHTQGHGIWKWHHYFEIYHRHFSKFIDRPVNLLEIGIYSGGSLDMWRSYFGASCHVFGIDIEDSCKAYESDFTTVFIGDQADRSFWRKFKRETPPMDILIDDGGHTPEQQRVTLEEMLPHLKCGGIYFCEDVTTKGNDFCAYATTLVDELNDFTNSLNEFQKSIHSIHFYPFCVVIEKNASRPQKFVAPKHGTQWQPFFDNRGSK